jgi:hypothetical protein
VSGRFRGILEEIERAAEASHATGDVAIVAPLHSRDVAGNSRSAVQPLQRRQAQSMPTESALTQRDTALRPQRPRLYVPVVQYASRVRMVSLDSLQRQKAAEHQAGSLLRPPVCRTFAASGRAARNAGNSPNNIAEIGPAHILNASTIGSQSA